MNKRFLSLVALTLVCAAANAQSLNFSASSVDFPYAEQTRTITVSAGNDGNGKWVVGSCPKWCLTSKEGNELSMTVWENPDTTARIGEVVIRNIYGTQEFVKSFIIKQEASPAEVVAARAAEATPDSLIVVRKSSGQPVVETVYPGAVPVTPVPVPGKSVKTQEPSGEVYQPELIEVIDKSDSHFIILKGNYQLVGSGDVYRPFADAGFLNFKLWPGFSTSCVQAVVYKGVDGQEPAWLFRPTIAFLNGEQRIGGSLGKAADINFLAAYSWTPRLVFMEDALSSMKIDYADGYDLFFGAEVSTHIPIFNVNLKAGYQISKCRADICPPTDSGEYSRIPFDNSGFVVSLGFTLGDRRNRGVTMLKLW